MGVGVGLGVGLYEVSSYLFKPIFVALAVRLDIHGQFFDLVGGIFATCGEPGPENAFLFNGDFVDRGNWGVECFLTLLSWKLKYPTHFFLTRGTVRNPPPPCPYTRKSQPSLRRATGNHESEAMTSRYGFREECVVSMFMV